MWLCEEDIRILGGYQLPNRITILGSVLQSLLLANNGLPGHVASTSAVPPEADVPGGVAEGPLLIRRCVTEMLYSALIGSIQRHVAKVLAEVYISRIIEIMKKAHP